MLAYERTPGCRMRFLAEALDDPTAADCGRCDRCAGPWYPTDVPDAARRGGAGAAAPGRASRSRPAPQWPTGMDRLGVPVKGRIPADEQVARGPGARPAHRPRLGHAGCAALLPTRPRTRRPTTRCCAACVARARRVGLGAPAGRGGDRARAARRPQLVASVGAHLARVGRLAWLGSARPCAATGRAASRAATAPSGWPGSGTPST